jgi:hypothetical protein
MRLRLIALFVVILVGLPSFAQNILPPVIETVDPSSGSVTGGTLVTLTGTNLSPSCGPYLISCNVVVRIGGKEAEIVERSVNRLVVVAPSNSLGRVDVEITTAGGTDRLTRAFAYGAADFRRLLLPVYIEGSVGGGFDSQWVTELSGFHRATDVARVTGDPQEQSGTVAGRTTFTPAVDTERQGHGRFIYVAEEDGEEISLNLRARDISRVDDNLGTELPVIGIEQTFVDEDIALVNVQALEGYRQTIRIYDLDGEFGRTVTVRVYGEDATTPLVTRHLTTSSAAVDTDYPAYPGQVNLDLYLIDELLGVEKMTVIVETPEEGRWWAFAAITNNETQLITTVTP